MYKLALHHLETLLWISRLGTFRAAAERLNATQPAISARMRELESQLGIEIFRREGRGVVLTARGRQLVKDCEPLLAGFEQALINVADQAGISGVVRVGAGEIAAASCLPGFVDQISRSFPGVSLEIELDLTARMLQHLLAGTRDLVFLAGPVASPEIRTASIGDVSLVWLASPKLLSCAGSDRKPRLWSVGSHSPIHKIMTTELANGGQDHGTINICNNVQMMIEIVILGAGAALFPETMVKEEIRAGTLVEFLPSPQQKIEFQAAIRAREQDPLVLELFRRSGDLRINRHA